MITIGRRADLPPHVVSSMHAFRHAIFVHRLGWTLPMLDGVERDQYDNEHAVYFITRDEVDQITACARLLPTTSDYMIPDLFSALLGEQPAPKDWRIWELSRFATSVRQSREGRVLSLSQPTLELLDSIFVFAQEGCIERLLVVTSIAIERLLLRAQYDVHRLAPPAYVGCAFAVALAIEVARSPPIVNRGMPGIARQRTAKSSA